MGTQIAVPEQGSPPAKFDAETLKAIGTREVDAGAPRGMFLPANMGEAMELAKLMAAGNFVPPHLRGKAGDCLAMVMQATRWSMDPFAVANKTYFVNDRMAYEAQLVNAVINSAAVLDGRLHPEWTGEGNDLVCTVTGRLKSDPEPKTRRVPIKNVTTRNSPLWKQDPEQQLAYYAMRAWVRLHAPEVLLGVYTPDELGAVEQREARAARIDSAAPLSANMLIAQSRPADLTRDAAPDVAEVDDVIEHALKTGAAGRGDAVASAIEQEDSEEEDESTRRLREIRGDIDIAKNAKQLKAVDDRWVNARAAYDDEAAAEIDGLINARRKALAEG